MIVRRLRVLAPRILVLALTLAAVAAAPPAIGAGAETQPRRLLEAHEQAAFRGVGRLDMGDGYCTATLFSETEAITAAHCLFDSRGRLRPTASLWFRAGYRDGRHETVRQVRRAAVHPDYVWNGPRSTWKEIAADVALLELDAPVLTSALPNYLPARLPRAGGAVALPSYGRGRDEALSLQDPCTILARDGAVATLDCRVDPGSSGSPVLARSPSGLRLVGVLSAAGRRASYAAVIEDTLPPLREALEAQTARVKTVSAPPAEQTPAAETPKPGGAPFAAAAVGLRDAAVRLLTRIEDTARAALEDQREAARPDEAPRPAVSAGFGLARGGGTMKSSRPPTAD
ncbi:MAG: trypsin-like peptidase domain-containing protein [Pseudomonadota bacterium]